MSGTSGHFVIKWRKSTGDDVPVTSLDCYEVVLDGVQLTGATRVQLDVPAGELPTLTVTFHPRHIEIDGDAARLVTAVADTEHVSDGD